jgi:hypothetical protein
VVRFRAWIAAIRTRPGRALAGAIASTLLFCAPSDATAAPGPGPALHWSAPAPCPDAADVEARIEATVGQALAATVDADVVVQRAEESRYVAAVRVRLRGVEVGERSLEEPTCEVLADAVVTVVAMSLQEETPDRDAPPATPVAMGRPSSATASTPSPEVDTSSLPRQRSEPRFAAGVVAMVDEGTLPSPALGAGIALASYPLAHLRIEGTLLRWGAQSGRVSGEGFGGSFQLTSADMRSCWSLLGNTVTIGPCAGLEVAHLDASGFGSTTSTHGNATWWSPSVGGLLHWTLLRPLGFGALADVVFPVARPTFVIVDGGAIHRAAFASLHGQIVAEMRF